MVEDLLDGLDDPPAEQASRMNGRHVNGHTKRQAREPITEEFQPDEKRVAHAASLGLDLEATRVGFVVYWQNKGKGLVNAQLAFENWCNNEIKFGQRGRPIAGTGGVRSAGGDDAFYRTLAEIKARG